MRETNDCGTFRYSANSFARPRSCESQILSDMAHILTHGYVKSISIGQLRNISTVDVIQRMQTVFETRKQRLKLLKDKHGTWADLNVAIGWTRTDPRLSQIQSGSIRSDRGTPYVMGDPTARQIEIALGLPEGWMDTPLSYSEIHSKEDPRALVMSLMEAMPPSEWATVVRLVDAIAQPDPKAANGE